VAYQKSYNYNPTYQPGQAQPFALSRSKIEQFIQCPRCFYLDRRLGIKQPRTPPFTLNSTVDELYKREFDELRKEKKQHSIQVKYKLDAIPAEHEMLDIWRENFKGIRTVHKDTNLEIFGALDDLWINKKNEYIVVDYKATARTQPVTQLGDAFYHDGYRRQLEVYQWLLRQNGLRVSNTGYWLYATAKKKSERFDGMLKFDQRLIEHPGDDSWIEPILPKIKACLESDQIPEVGKECGYCPYAKERTQMTLNYLNKNSS
jgi:RecB family exonuclease